jgi:hypothetical protein
MIKENSVLAIFNEHCTRPIDRKFSLAVVSWVRDIARKSDRLRDHINFLGGNLIGTYPFVMVNEDFYMWKHEVLQIIDYDKLQSDLYDLPDINRSYKVSSDAINLSFLWVVYRALISDLPEKEKMILATAALMGLQYKILSSLHTRRFPYPADEGVAQMVYESLDNKSQLKRFGSWQAMLDDRAESILAHDALHAKTIRTLEPDLGLVAALNDISTRLRSLVQSLTDKFYEIKEKQSKLITTSKFTVLEGEAILKDSVNSYAHTKNAMYHIVPDKNNFIKTDLVEAVILTVKTATEFYLTKVLQFMSENYTATKIKGHHIDIPELVDEIIMFTLSLLKRENIHLTNIPEVANKLKNVLSSSRFKSREYDDIKEKIDFITEHSLINVHVNVVVSTRIAVVFYIALRALLAK